MKKLHETHNEYILDSLEDDRDRLIDEIAGDNPENEYKIRRLIEVIVEIVEKSNAC
ncbi:hypothetical protein [uncultured Clostridium sp.]|uniref:hypothetical protein n=1 Tax=uncultured Clostridium sp. TaxID=59620 RepID=UPI0028E4211D|nr:hypothetical protein [uncultured Clostridium sp.]